MIFANNSKNFRDKIVKKFYEVAFLSWHVFVLHSVCNYVDCHTATPGKCSGLTVSDITKNACRLRWKPPDDDGGSRITHYVVERQEVGKPYWTTVASFAKVKVSLS